MKRVRYLVVLALISIFIISSFAVTVVGEDEGLRITVDGTSVRESIRVYTVNDEEVEVELGVDWIEEDIPEGEFNATWDLGDDSTQQHNGTIQELMEKNITHSYGIGEYNITLTLDHDDHTYIHSIELIVENDERGTYLTAIGAGLAVGIAGMGAGIGVGITGAGGAGTVAEDPDKFGKCLVFQALPQTQAIYGLLVAVLLLLFTGVLGGDAYVPLPIGIVSIGVGLAVGIAGLSAVGQGIAASGSVAAYSEKEELFGKGMVFSVLPETQAIYGLLIAILLMVFTGLLGGEIHGFMLGDYGFGLGVVAVGAGIAVGVAGLSGIGQGVAAGSGISSVAEKEELFGKGMVFSVLPETQAIYGLLIAILLMVFTGLLAGDPLAIMAGDSGYAMGLIAVGAGIAVGVAGLSGIGQGIAAASGISCVAEDEDIFGKGMVFSVLPETQAIYGLLIAILLMIFSGLLGEGTTLDIGIGLVGVGAGLAVGIAGLSGIGQGIAAASGVATVTGDEKMFGKSMVFSVLPETQAIYGLLIAILLMVFSGLLTGDFPAAILGEQGYGLGMIAVGAGLAVGIAGISGVGQGITSGAAIPAVAKRDEVFGKNMIFSVMSETFAIFGLLIAILLLIFTGLLGDPSPIDPSLGLVGVGAGLAVGIAGMGAGIGVGIVGASGAGIVAEDPDKFGKSLVFQALPQTQAIYALLVGILLMIFTGLLAGEADPIMAGETGRAIGIMAIGAGLAVGLAGLSSIGQGIAAASSVTAVAEKEDLFGKGMVFSVLPETQAIYGLLVAILLMVFSGMLGDVVEMEASVGLVGIGAGLAVGIAGLSGIGQGIAASGGISTVSEDENMFGKGMVFSVLPETQAIYGLLIAILLLVFSGLLAGDLPELMMGDSGYAVGLIAVGAGLAVGIAGLSGIGQGIAASSGIGCVAEKEELFGRGMVFSVLPETQAIYGLLVAILLMIFSGLLGEGTTLDVAIGLVGVGAGLAVGIAGLSGIGQGIAAASGVATVAEDEKMFGRGMVFSVLPETQAIYGLLIAILLMVFSGMLGGDATISMGMGIAAVGAGLAIGIAGVSGVGQGITSGSAIAAVTRREEVFGKGMIFSVMSETFAIFGLLIAIFIIVFLGFM